MASLMVRSAVLRLTRPSLRWISTGKGHCSELNTKDEIEDLPTPADDMLTRPDYFQVHNLFNIKELFTAGVHYGHHEGCWNPLMKPYLYGTHEHYHVIDLKETLSHLQLALNVLCHTVYRGGKVLFVSCHPQFETQVQALARESGEYFVTQRWRGGTLTNAYMVLGTRNLPDLMVVLGLPSLGRNSLAIKEAAMCNIPSIGIVDSDCDPNLVMYPIPGNDDSPSAIQLYCRVFKSAILKAKEKRRVVKPKLRTLSDLDMEER